VLVSTGQIDHGAARHGLNKNLEGCEFAISMNCCDAKATLETVLTHLLESLNVWGTVRFARWLTAAKHVLRLKVKKKGILFTKNMSAV
jgi:hypothetical protein